MVKYLEEIAKGPAVDFASILKKDSFGNRWGNLGNSVVWITILTNENSTEHSNRLLARKE